MTTIIRKSLRTALAAASVAALTACGSDSSAPATSAVSDSSANSAATSSASKSIVGVAASNPTFSSLVAAVQFASTNNDLVDLLSGSGNFTVFAPTNAAFDALAKEITGDANATATALLVPANKALVRAVLEYHVLGSKVSRAQIPLGAAIDPVLAGADSFKIETRGAGLQITDGRLRTANIVQADVDADNGLIHAIDKVILPAEATPGRSIVQIAAGNADFSSLVAALQFASNDGDLVRLLSGTGAFTVFAPSNDAFDALAKELTGSETAKGADLLVPANKALVRSVLQYHVLASKVLAAGIKSGVAIEPALGDGSFFKIDLAGGKAVIADGRARSSNIVATDVQANNGVIHIIDKVILPANKSIVDIAAGNTGFSSLVAALQFASNDGDLVRLLSGAGTFTVFAPTNAAFDSLARELTGDHAATGPQLLVAGNRDLIRSVLQYHVLAARVLVAEVPLGAPIDPALAGDATFTISAAAGKVTITDARHRSAGITATDLFASNGVVHVIDNVILPPAH